MILTFKYRIKDATVGKYLDCHSRSVNFVWNYCCEIQRKVEAYYKAGAPKRRWPSHFDLVKLTTGCAADLGLHSDTVSQICKQFVISRNAARHAPRFRASGGAKRALGWLPFIKRAVKLDGAHVVYLKRKFHFWKSRDIPDAIKTGCFTQDARGRWYVCFQCEVPDDLPTGNGEIGIDLGLKTLATCSNGDTIPALQHYRQYEAVLAVAQRAGNKRRVKAIHAKIANVRKDQLHKASTKIARENRLSLSAMSAPHSLPRPGWLNPFSMQVGRCCGTCSNIKPAGTGRVLLKPTNDGLPKRVLTAVQSAALKVSHSLE